MKITELFSRAVGFLKELEPTRKWILSVFIILFLAETVVYSGLAQSEAEEQRRSHSADQMLFGENAPLEAQSPEQNEETKAEEPDREQPEKQEAPVGAQPEAEADPQKASAEENVPADPEDGILILVNKTHYLEKTYRPDDLTGIRYYAENRSAECRFLRSEAADHFHEMIEAASADGLTIVMTTAYRSYDYQKNLWDSYVAAEGEAAASRYSAKPGQSEHQTGLAVDVSAPSVGYQLTAALADTEEGIWLKENAVRFGFILRYPNGGEDITGYLYEPWHFRYVGKDAAKTITDKGITLEEYLSE